MESYKQGQYADAIKWFSWGMVLLEKCANDSNSSVEILTCRASCYKEVGDYKKAIDDCSKVGFFHTVFFIFFVMKVFVLYQSFLIDFKTYISKVRLLHGSWPLEGIRIPLHVMLFCRYRLSHLKGCEFYIFQSLVFRVLQKL